MATAFAAVVLATVDLIMGLVGKIGGQPDFKGWEPGGLPFGAWVTAVIAFLVLAAVVYFLVVKPYTARPRALLPQPGARHARGRRAAPPDPRPAGQPDRRHPLRRLHHPHPLTLPRAR